LGGVEERDARCCYAKSNKHWFTDPQGVLWETFESFGTIDAHEQDPVTQTEQVSACGGSGCCA
jgi:hypothetical protein